ncbi:MAG: gamma-glutamyltransferase family protein [Actinomycetota bacterium]|nr:gamma-glutamyltransferase family protein [Actinomycetota bacterium]
MAGNFTTRPEIKGTLGIVAATHYLAAQSGMAMLERGGNAFDAAVAAGLVLHVVEPHQCGPGGEVPAIGYSAAEGEVFVLDGQGPLPEAATPARFAELGLDRVPGTGLLAACVPGAFGAWFALLDRFGTLGLREVFAPAIHYAKHGFPALASLASVLAKSAEFVGTNWPSTAALWLGDGPPIPGQRLWNRPLAETFERIVAEGEAAGADRSAQIEQARRAVYEGFVAEAIDGFARQVVSDEAGEHAGLLGGSDLARWRASLEPAVRFQYRDLEVCKTGPWGQGPVFLQQLALLEEMELGALGPTSAELIHLVTEASKLAFADREAYYGDPRKVEVPLSGLLDPAYSTTRRALVGDRANHEIRPGAPEGFTPRLPDLLDQLIAEAARGGMDRGVVPRSGIEAARRDTTHLDVADRFGNLISVTPSGGWLQASPTIPGLGFCLGTRAQMCWVQDGLASSVRPGGRPRTTLSPSLVLRDGAPWLAFGTPGGDQQDQWTMCFFLRHVEHGLDLQAAIDAPNWHHAHVPSSFAPRDAHPGELVVETSVGEEVLAALRERGHRVVEAPPYSLGRLTAVGRLGDGMLRAGADARGAQAYAVGR